MSPETRPARLTATHSETRTSCVPGLDHPADPLRSPDVEHGPSGRRHRTGTDADVPRSGRRIAEMPWSGHARELSQECPGPADGGVSRPDRASCRTNGSGPPSPTTGNPPNEQDQTAQSRAPRASCGWAGSGWSCSAGARRGAAGCGRRKIRLQPRPPATTATISPMPISRPVQSRRPAGERPIGSRLRNRCGPVLARVLWIGHRHAECWAHGRAGGRGRLAAGGSVAVVVGPAPGGSVGCPRARNLSAAEESGQRFSGCCVAFGQFAEFLGQQA